MTESEWTYRGQDASRNYVFQDTEKTRVVFNSRTFFASCSSHPSQEGVCYHITEVINRRADRAAFAAYLDDSPAVGRTLWYRLKVGHASVYIERVPDVTPQSAGKIFRIANLGPYGAILSPGDSLYSVGEVLRQVYELVDTCPAKSHYAMGLPSHLTFEDRLLVANGGMCGKCNEMASGSDLIPDVASAPPRRGRAGLIHADPPPKPSAGMLELELRDNYISMDPTHTDVVQFEEKIRSDEKPKRVTLKGEAMEEIYARLIAEGGI